MFILVFQYFYFLSFNLLSLHFVHLNNNNHWQLFYAFCALLYDDEFYKIQNEIT